MQPTHPYGSGSRRFLAFLADSLVISALGTVIDLALGAPVRLSTDLVTPQTGAAFYLKLTLQLAYWPLFESSVLQATPGKLLCRLRVADLAGRRLSFPRAFVRNVAKVLSLLPLGFGFLMIAVTVRNQCLHDKIAGTVVLKRNAPYPPEDRTGELQ